MCHASYFCFKFNGSNNNNNNKNNEKKRINRELIIYLLLLVVCHVLIVYNIVYSNIFQFIYFFSI